MLSIRVTAETPPPPDLSPRCVAHWIEQGLTSRTHPVLQYALTTFVDPVGLRCEALEIEPFSVIETGVGGLMFHRPAFDPKAVTVPAMRALLGRYPVLEAKISGGGLVDFLVPTGAGIPASAAEDVETLSYEIAAGVENARAFILEAAMALVDGETPDRIKQAFLAADTTPFCEQIKSQL